MYQIPKKIWATGAIFILSILIASLLPLQSNVIESKQFQCNADAMLRQLYGDSLWHKWWPGETQLIDHKFNFIIEGLGFTIKKIYPNSFELQTTSKSFTTTSFLNVVSQGNNNVMLTLSTSVILSPNPIDRVLGLAYSSRLRKSYQEILSTMASYFSRTENLYGFDIKETTVLFGDITTTSKIFDQYPASPEIYSLISELEYYINKNGGTIVGSPMLFTSKRSDKQVFVQVGLPTDRELLSTSRIKSKQMLKGGNILVTKVVGGRRAISLALKQVEFYIQDHHRNIIAIPYEYLITDRTVESDSSKWVTEIYFPVI